MNASHNSAQGEPQAQRARDESERREQFIEVALQLFSGRAYAEVSVEEIAERAGAAKGLLYYYFGSKRGLYVAGLERLAAELHAQLAAVSAEEGAPPLERLMHGLDAHLAFIERYPDGYRELLASAGTHPEIDAVLAQGRAIVLELLIANIPPEVPRDGVLELALKGWGGLVDRIELDWIADGGATREQVRELCSQLLVAAVVAAVEVDKAAPKGATKRGKAAKGARAKRPPAKTRAAKGRSSTKRA